ncbi:hypothetical protein DMN91_007939 [Ooceraea biroi]|uniref:Uncharacterized protein n=1 Tax=Ooceraea biroi TaxID=2015173 RepID=A0A3L8DGS8_OOCBI|nr:hypothetical protein DMN91_007939 [Ooceraea biroi]
MKSAATVTERERPAGTSFDVADASGMPRSSEQDHPQFLTEFHAVHPAYHLKNISYPPIFEITDFKAEWSNFLPWDPGKKDDFTAVSSALRQYLPEKDAPYILDIDLDFFSTGNPFKHLLERVNLYDKLTPLFNYRRVESDEPELRVRGISSLILSMQTPAIPRRSFEKVPAVRKVDRFESGILYTALPPRRNVFRYQSDARAGLDTALVDPVCRFAQVSLRLLDVIFHLNWPKMEKEKEILGLYTHCSRLVIGPSSLGVTIEC